MRWNLSDKQDSIKARARLALRAERAFGLRSIPVRSQPASNDLDAPAPDSPAQVAQKQVQQSPSPTSPTDLFGNRVGPAPIPVFQSPPAFATAPLSRDQKIAQLKVLDENEVKVCRRCRLCEQRTHTVFGEGDADARILFIGEGPGENEDLQGRPFVGRAGELLNKWITAMGLRREQVFIANIVKCRPPGNREPSPDEVATCTPFLEKQIEIIRPPVIVTLGRPSAQHMLATKNSMGRMRGHWHDWRGIKLMPTYHPAYVLRNYTYETRAAVWSDLQLVMKQLDLAIPKRERH
ncbi:MAG TPA: uracil-DNA glycosylase [Tepidisphaeraceae bacterium]|jgi:DNA polymerase